MRKISKLFTKERRKKFLGKNPKIPTIFVKKIPSKKAKSFMCTRSTEDERRGTTASEFLCVGVFYWFMAWREDECANITIELHCHKATN
jgi:hypothetical protein